MNNINPHPIIAIQFPNGETSIGIDVSLDASTIQEVFNRVNHQENQNNLIEQQQERTPTSSKWLFGLGVVFSAGGAIAKIYGIFASNTSHAPLLGTITIATGIGTILSSRIIAWATDR